MTDDPATTRASLLNRLGRDPGDRSAWSEFESRYRPKLLSWCRRWGLQDSDAEDVAQTVLMQLALKMRTFVYDPSRSFRAWLRTLTRHAWADYLGDRDRRPAIAAAGGDAALEALRSAEARIDLERRLEEEFDLELLELASERVRARVNEQTWRVFELVTIEGLSGIEAAERIGMAPSAVFKAKSNVTRMLREEIARLESPEP